MFNMNFYGCPKDEYIPNSNFSNSIGLKNGTIFPELVDTYKPMESMERLQFLKGGNKNV